MFAPLGGRAVVGRQHDDGVVEFAQAVDKVDDPAQVVVGLLQEGRIDLHLPGVEFFRVVGETLPGLHFFGARRQLSSRRDDALRELALVNLLAPLIQPLSNLPS